jgi:hypothetical protein
VIAATVDQQNLIMRERFFLSLSDEFVNLRFGFG